MLNRDNLKEAIQMQLSQKQKNFSDFFFRVLKSMSNFKYLPKKMTVTADLFPKTVLPKNMVR